VLGEAFEFWFGNAWGHLVTGSADFSIAAGDDATSVVVLVWSLASDTFQLVHTVSVFLCLLFDGISVS